MHHSLLKLYCSVQKTLMTFARPLYFKHFVMFTFHFFNRCKGTSVECVFTNLPSLVIVRGTWQLPILVSAIYVLGAASVGAETILYKSWRILLVYLLGKKQLNFKNFRNPGQNSASLEWSPYHQAITTYQ